jgi:fumarate reductase flavoprotein subunit
LPADAFAATLAAIPKDGVDAFGRRFGGAGLQGPLRAVKVTGALFHTQGGLEVDDAARVMGADGPIAGLFAVGGAALGVSGRGDSGYLSGNGLLSAVALGRVAGRAAAGG